MEIEVYNNKYQIPEKIVKDIIKEINELYNKPEYISRAYVYNATFLYFKKLLSQHIDVKKYILKLILKNNEKELSLFKRNIKRIIYLNYLHNVFKKDY